MKNAGCQCRICFSLQKDVTEVFAFIAGDAWKVMQPHQAHDVGEVNGDALSAQEYQNLVEE